MSDSFSQESPNGDSMRRIHARRAAFLSGGILLIAALVVLGLLPSEPWAFAREIWWARGSGFVGLFFLLLTLSITPSLRALACFGHTQSGPRLVALRRALGITTALAALAHALVAYVGVLDRNLSVVLTSPHFRSGALALGILLVLLVSSFPRVVSLFRIRLWKELQRLAYLAALLVLLHALGSPFASRTLTLGAFALCFGWGLWRFRQRT